MAKVVEDLWKFWVGGLSEDFFQDPIKVTRGFLRRGIEGGEVGQIAGFVSVQRGMEFQQNQAVAADVADEEVGAVGAGVEAPPSQFGQLIAADEEGHGTVEPIRVELQLSRHTGGSLGERLGQWVSACVASIQSDHIDIVGIAGGDFLSQEGTPSSDDKRISDSGFLKQGAEKMECLIQGVFRKFAHEVL